MNITDSQNTFCRDDNLYDVNLSDELAISFSEYNYFDLCRAIFCINAWRYNRAHLEFYLSLNYALKTCNRDGTKPIESYGEFCGFFETLEPKLNSLYDDEVTPDFGDVKISFDDEFFPVFLGTCHGFVFPFMQSLYVLSKSLGIVDQMKCVLLYVKNMVQHLEGTNLYEGPKDLFTLHKPTEAFFNACKYWYIIRNLEVDSELYFLSNVEREKIDETHFILYREKLYPLFNPSILIDAFHILYRGIDISKEKQSQIADYILYQTLYSNFDLKPESTNLLIQVGVVSDSEKHKIVDDVLFDYLLRDRDKTLLFINENRLKNKDIDSLIKTIDDIVSKQQLKLVEFSGEGKCRLWDYSLCDEVCIIVYDNKIILENVVKSNANSLTSLYLYDLITILYRAKSGSDICDFMQSFRKSHWEQPLFGGMSALFEAWTKQHKELLPGALNATILVTDPYMVEWDIFEDYLDLNKWYPFAHCEKLFNNPFCWSVVDDDNGYFKTLTNNAVFGFAGYYRKVANSYLFFTFNFAFEDINEKYDERHEVIRLIEDINCRNFVIFENALIECGLYDFNGVRIMYMPMEYAETVDNTGFLRQNRQYIYSDYTINDGILFIRYAVNEAQLMNELLSVKDKSLECKCVVELLSCMAETHYIDFNNLKRTIYSHRTDKKDIAALQFELKYYYSLNNSGIIINDEYYAKVRKLIAIDCKKVNIESRIYSAQEATDVIRTLQQLIIPRFENIVSEYNKYDLHELLLSELAYNIHNKNLNYKRYSVNNDDNVSDMAKEVTGKNIIDIRERNKDNIRDLLYLIETNLAISHNGNKVVTLEEMKYLLAYSHWLMVLQDGSDNAHYNLAEVKIEIEDDFRVSTIVSEEQQRLSKERHRRTYDNCDYRPNLQDDKDMLKQAADCFYLDTGIKLDKFFNILDYLSKEFNFTFKTEKVADVFSLSEEDIKEDIKDWLTEENNFSDDKVEEVYKALNFLVIDELQIKTVNGKKEDFIPVWQREGRDNQFIVRPVIRDGENLIFSPTVIYELRTMWEYGIINFYLPYEYGLENLKKFLEKWKSECEKCMEIDLETFMKDQGYMVRRNLQLHKLDKKSGHPTNLGDYDVFAIDTTNKVVWNLECKFLNMVGSLREYYNHQYSFFISNKKDEKFARRIEYLKDHLSSILKAFGICDAEKYAIKNYMVTNKVFHADIKQVNFEIITFHELKRLF